MKLSDTTLAILKNFSSFNTGVLLLKGKKQKTMAPDRSVLVEAIFNEEIPEQFGIYDLPQFLGNVTTLGNPELNFSDKSVIMDDGSIRLTFHSCSPSVIATPPDKELELPRVDVSLTLTNQALQKLLRLAAMNDLPMLSVIGKNGKLSIKTHENSDTSNLAEMVIEDYAGEDFSAKFKTEQLKMIPDDYDVKIALNAFATFENKAGTLKYFVALQTK